MGPSAVLVIAQAQPSPWTCRWGNETQKNFASLGPGPLGPYGHECRLVTPETGLLHREMDLNHLVMDEILGT